MNIQRFVLGCFGIVFLGFGLAGVFTPEDIARQINFVVEVPAAKMEFMATYGGFFLGIGAFMLYCLKDNIELGLISVMFTMGAIFITRMIGYAVYGSADELQITYAVAELFSVIVALAVLKKAPAHKPAIA